MYQYTLNDGRNTVSPVSLHYALDNGILDLNTVKSSHLSSLQIYDNETAAYLAVASADGGTWHRPGTAGDPQSYSHQRNYCIYLGNTICIRDGSKYIRLNKFLETASEAEKDYVLTQIAVQAAMAQLALERAGQEDVG